MVPGILSRGARFYTLTGDFEFLQHLFKRGSGDMGIEVTSKSQTVRADDQRGNKRGNGHGGHGSASGATGW